MSTFTPFSGDREGDFEFIYKFLSGSSQGLEIELNVDEGRLRKVVHDFYDGFPSGWVREDCNPFKAVAFLTIMLRFHSPIISGYDGIFGKIGLVYARETQETVNTMFGYKLSTALLNGAKIYWNHCEPPEEKILENRIKVSAHFLDDFVCNISTMPETQCAILALIYEALAYRWNGETSYEATQ